MVLSFLMKYEMISSRFSREAPKKSPATLPMPTETGFGGISPEVSRLGWRQAYLLDPA